MRRILVLWLICSGIAMAQPKLIIPYSGFAFSTDSIGAGTTSITASMYVKNEDFTFSFSDTLYIHVGVLDTLGQPQYMSGANMGSQTINTNDSTYLPSVNITVNTSYFKEGNNTVVIWPAAPNSYTLDSIWLPFYYTTVKELLANEIPVKIGPNPASESFYLTDPENLVKHVRIQEMNGALIGTVKTNTLTNVDRLPNGIYILRIETSVGIFSRKLIIQH
jgi:Secretion system C-terminal sorting domain